MPHRLKRLRLGWTKSKNFNLGQTEPLSQPISIYAESPFPINKSQGKEGMSAAEENMKRVGWQHVRDVQLGAASLNSKFFFWR